MTLDASTHRRTKRFEIDASTFVRVTLYISYGPTAHDGTCEATLDNVDVDYLLIDLGCGRFLNFMNTPKFPQISKDKVEEIEAYIRRRLESDDAEWFEVAFN